MSPHSTELNELIKSLGSSETGLTDADAAALLEKYGKNKLREKKKKTMLQRFFEQFKDIMILILIAAAAVSFVIACIEQNPKEFFEPALILLIVVLNAVMGVVQESKAEKSLEALQNLSAPHARVIRGGREEIIDAADLVPGDIIKIEAGDFVPADARLIASSSLKSEESALTGESVPSDKDANALVAEDAPLGDRKNMIYSGCSVSYGSGKAIVTGTGMSTEMGKIAGLLEGESDSQTPLQKKLAQLGKYLGFVALGACAVIFIIGLINNLDPMELFMTAVSLAVSAIPEGLPAIVTVVLSIGVQRMVKRNAIIRRLPAVETLGSASVICSDKTGTLTQNRMTLVRGWLADSGKSEEITDDNGEDIRRLIKLGALCCDGSVVFENDGTVKHIGDPTETSIVFAATRNGMHKDEINEECPRVFDLPFDSDRKLMTTVNKIDGKLTVITKGAYDMLIQRCTSGDIDSSSRVCEEMSADALRVIAIAITEIDSLPDNPDSDTLENGLTLVGLVGMIDPPRDEARDAVAVCKSAGIRPVMITGDHVITASAIAKDLGIYNDGDEAITGAELQKMSDDELDERIRNISVYARVSPEDKIRIVKAWQKQGEVVSMTGDGVNDAPALKAADIGCAMGITGTDVAKGAADMTLTDDNFATIVDAVREGRGIYANIRKVVGYLLGTNIGEVISVFVAMLLFHKTPLLSMQLLWINLVTDSLPAIALGMEPVEKDIMEKKPKPKKEGIFAHGLGIQVVLQGMMFAALTLIGYYFGWKVIGSESAGQTMAFIVLAMSQVMQSFNMRSNKSLFKIGPFTNKTLNLSALISFILTMLVALTPIRVAFGLTLLEPIHYLIALGLAFVPTVIMELAKVFKLIK